MNTLLLSALMLFSFSLYAQEDTVDISEETIVTAPAEATEAPVASLPEETKEEVKEEVVEQTPVAAPVEPEVKAVIAGPASPMMKTEAEVETHRSFNPRASHWLTTFAFENTKYELFPDDYSFTGKKNFKSDDHQLWGGRIGFGGEIYLGAGFVTRSLVEGYYNGTLFSQVLNGGNVDADVKFAYTKKTGQLLGGDASQSLGWMFDLKTKNPFMDEMTYLAIETYVEAGLGKGWAYNRINYNYKLPTTDEKFKLRTRDDFINARVGAGINMTSNQGFFLSLRATVNRYDITKRKVDGYVQENGDPTTTINEEPKDVKIKPVVIYTLGGGYKF